MTLPQACAKSPRGVLGGLAFLYGRGTPVNPCALLYSPPPSMLHFDSNGFTCRPRLHRLSISVSVSASVSVPVSVSHIPSPVSAGTAVSTDTVVLLGNYDKFVSPGNFDTLVPLRKHDKLVPAGKRDDFLAGVVDDLVCHGQIRDEEEGERDRQEREETVPNQDLPPPQFADVYQPIEDVYLPIVDLGGHCIV